jgi:hypothetical protein
LWRKCFGGPFPGVPVYVRTVVRGLVFRLLPCRRKKGSKARSRAAPEVAYLSKLRHLLEAHVICVYSVKLGFHTVACVVPNCDCLMAMSPCAVVTCTRSGVRSVSMLGFADMERHIGPNISLYSSLSLYFSVWFIPSLLGPGFFENIACL